MSQYTKNASGAGGPGISTINGDLGSVTGASITIFADNAANNSGSSVLFNNSGTVSTLNVTDANNNTIIGNLAGNIAATLESDNAILGAFALQSVTTGALNASVGRSNLTAATTGSNNAAFGSQSLQNITTGVYNSILGSGSGNALTGAESGNLYLSNAGVVGESHTVRIGTQGTSNAGPTGEQNICYIAGITGATPVSGNHPQVVVCDNAGNLTPISSGSAGQVLTSNGTATPSFQAAGGGGSATAFYAYASSTQSNVTGAAVIYTILFDSTSRNDGSAYNPATGLFTAPKTGLYSFNSTLALEGLNATGTSNVIAFIGSAISQVLYEVGFGTVSSTTNNVFLTCAFTIPMTMGDTVGMQIYSNQSTQTVSLGGGAISSGTFNVNSSFSGFFVGT